MKHHFGDLLDRSGNYWTTVPNRERHAYHACDEITDKQSVKILTISKSDENWRQIFDCPNLEELTLHEPSKEQVAAIADFRKLKRLRITFFRPKDIQFITGLVNLEELVLEYVSGFSDLSPLQKLPNLKSLHLENLRRVSDFNGLRGIHSMRYLFIGGTLDWKQPIDDFTFLGELPNLEILALGFVINKSEYPAFRPILKLQKLKKIRIGLATFQTKEYAFLEAAFPHGVCVSFGDLPWQPCYQINEGYMEFIGKGAGNVKLSAVNAEDKILAFRQMYEGYKKEAQGIIASHRE